MGCGSCALKTNGGCSTGGKSCGCNRKSVYDWLADIPEPNYKTIIPVEVSFKNGARKSYYQCRSSLHALTGDVVVVESEIGYDVGTITLSGELVKLQMKKYKVRKKLPDLQRVLRRANEADLTKLNELRTLEEETLIKARVIARNLKLDMKIGDAEYQGNGKKVTIFYTAEDRVDFRQLIKDYAREFRVKIEMRQIGMRQESARIGGIGACGRELCCSTWLNDFKSVSTSAARYQNLSINQTKLSGQCGRLKCCLNFELDTYLEAWKKIPKKVDRIETAEGVAFLQKTDILRHLMIYKYPDKPVYYKLSAEDVTSIKEMNRNGQKPENLYSLAIREVEDDLLGKDEDLVGQIKLESLPTRKRRGNRRGRNKNQNQNRSKKAKSTKPQGQKPNERKDAQQAKSQKPNSAKKQTGNRRRKGGQQKTAGANQPKQQSQQNRAKKQGQKPRTDKRNEHNKPQQQAGEQKKSNNKRRYSRKPKNNNNNQNDKKTDS